MSENNPSERAQMVNWYSPSQLSDTAIKTVISTIIGENADPRLITAATDKAFFDYSHELTQNGFDFEKTDIIRNEIWIDYVSDVGDGWNPTYSVAYSLARSEIKIAEKTLKRGGILVFGGDGVYPTAETDEYEKRLVNPYRTAFETTGQTDAVGLQKQPHVFALPGNHDWYDSLVAFQKLFSTHIFNKRIFAGGWHTRQKRSYFTLKLPSKWWLLGVDLQLSHNIDVPQLEYFERIINTVMEKGDKVILCVPEPYWVKSLKYEGLTDKFEKKEASIEKLEKLFEENEIEVKLYLAGDLHHYRRFATEDGQHQKITAGGGGAFLHPTHDFDFRDKPIESKTKNVSSFHWQTNYPDYDASKKMDWKNVFGFLFKNKTFGALTAILYILLAFLIHGEINSEFTWRKALMATVSRGIEQPLALIVIILMVMGLVFFTDSNSKIYKRVAGTIHGLFHLAAIFFLGWLGYLLMLYFVGEQNFLNLFYRSEHAAYINFEWLICIIFVCGIGGYIIGSVIMGLYLFISLHFFKRHDNEAFSAMKVEDYKNFLRLHIDSDGSLTIYPFKIEKVAKEWNCETKNKKQICTPKEEIKPELIEEPIVIK
ncbi:hypothetical protein BH20ACI4_BH20ACI4_27550 [soil metagenome]